LPKTNDCLIFSFGIHSDESFDLEMNQNHDCLVHLFDPFIEADRFVKIRNANKDLSQSVKISVNSKLTFYRHGITSRTAKLNLNTLKPPDLVDFDHILDMTNSRNKVIDVFKMDIEDAEVGVVESIDMDYFCKYVKQFVLETHLKMPRQLLYKIEKCFYLSHRDQRFFELSDHGPTGYITEWQKNAPHMIDIKKYANELDLATFMFTTGELYFVNLNFLK
jgi:hypothetical protein